MGGLDKISMHYHSSDLRRLSLQSNELQFGAMTFFAKEHKDETCGSNGLPLTPNSIIIFGRAQILKSIKSPVLCEYLDIVRSKHERAIVVSQYCGEPLANYLNRNKFSFENIKRIAFQILLGLAEIHDMNIVHRNLSKENILLQNNMDIKLFNYGLFHMTDQGRLVSFPIVKPLYAAPEILLERSNNNFSNPKMDIWSLGMILTELVLDKPLWNTLKLGQCIRKIISLIHGSSSVLERIIREHNCYERYEAIPKDLRLLIEDCLNVSPNNRPSSKDLLEKQMFKELRNELFVNKNNKTCKSFKTFTLTELYYWWKLAGGDVFLELKNQGLIRSTPPILSFPDMILMDGTILGQGRDPATLYEPRIIKIPLDTLYRRFSHIPFSNYYPLIHSQSAIINKFEAPLYNAFDLPLIIREKDPEYQFHRTILFRRLLHGYPSTRDQIVKEAKLDIPPLLRGDIWAAMLNVRYNEEYKKIDKETSTITDRQIEVDIPRCHQYNELLSSSVGHLKLKRILKAWISKNVEYVYWQGLDSLTAPFLYLNFNDEAKAFACLSAFIPKYLHNFFLKDNSVIIQEYLTKFSQLIAFHDPVLANHLQAINFVPELFAIPWFLTMFSHVFPLHKIFHLWDKLLLGDSSFPLHVGLSILTQLRDTLLKSGFNECILLFSDLPEVDIELCVGYSLETYKTTPQSITMRASQDNKNTPESHIAELAMQELTREKCPYISVSDVIDLIKNHSSRTILIDIRNSVQFNRSCIKSSINIPYSSVAFGEENLDSLGTHSELLQDTQKKIVVVIGSFETDLELFPRFLLKCNVPKVCVLYGGFNVLLSNISNTFITHNQT